MLTGGSRDIQSSARHVAGAGTRSGEDGGTRTTTGVDGTETCWSATRRDADDDDDDGSVYGERTGTAAATCTRPLYTARNFVLNCRGGVGGGPADDLAAADSRALPPT